MAKYWFARRRLDHPGNRKMAPVSREGWLVVAGFVGAMVVGGLGWLFLGMNGQLVSGVALFVTLAIAGSAMFITMAYKRGDMHHTIDDYRSGRVDNSDGPVT